MSEGFVKESSVWWHVTFLDNVVSYENLFFFCIITAVMSQFYHWHREAEVYRSVLVLVYKTGAITTKFNFILRRLQMHIFHGYKW